MQKGASGSQRLARIAEVAHRRKWLAATVFALAATAGVTVALSLPNVYRGTATVLVEQHATDLAGQGEQEARLQLISQEILSRARLESVVSGYGLYPGLVQRSSAQAAVGQMRRDIHTEFKTGLGTTISIIISYRNPDRLVVAKVANALASFYVEGERKIREQRTSGAVQVLKTQLEDLKRSLQEQEVELADFQVRHMGELPQQADVNQANLQRLDGELRTTTEERMRAFDRRNELLKQLADAAAAEATTGTGPGPATVRLQKLREELSSLNKRYSDKYPDVIRLKEEVAALEKEVAQADAGAPAGATRGSGRLAEQLRETLGEVEAEIKARKSDEARLRAEIDEHIRRLENSPRQQRSYQDISRDYQTKRDLYDALRKRYEQAQLEDDGASQPASPYRILDPAVVPTVPDAPNRPVLALLALIAALAAAVGAAALAEHLDGSFHAADDIRSFTRVPVLASIPVIITAGDRRAARWRFCVGVLSLLLALGSVVLASYRFARTKVGVVAMLGRS